MLDVSMSNHTFRLSDDNFLLYAMRHYENPCCISEQEFLSDLKRINYIKKHLSKYIRTGILKERLILNHIISVYNVFPLPVATQLLFYRIEPEFWSELKTFLVYLNCMPESISYIQEKDLISSQIPINMNIANVLRQLQNVKR